MWAKKDYITYESSSPVPEIDASVRQRSRYGGVGVTAGDEWMDFFSDPDEPPAERAEAVLAAAEPEAVPAIDSAADSAAETATEEPSPPCAPKRFASKRPIDEGMRASGAAAFANEPLEPAKFSQFRNVYESRDGRLCVFEDESGHLVAVNAARLA